MGILNLTPDSFYDGGRYKNDKAILTQVDKMLNEGASFIDVGAYSSRPGADHISVEEEKSRLLPILSLLQSKYGENILISVDTFRSEVAKEALQHGTALINDISAGRYDPGLFAAVAELNVPYILMHMQGSPKTMQQNPQYEKVVQEVLDFFIAEIGKLRALNVHDVLVDPGFGFGKTVEHNYQLLKNMHVFQMLEVPVLAGLSRKSMINKVLKIKASDALNGTTALHMVALQQGAKVLRVHDVRPAVETVKLWQQLEQTQ